MNASKDQVEQLKLLSMPTNNFIDTYEVAESIVETACNSHHNLWSLIKDCQDHISGKKPMSQEKLKKNGMSWVSNFNFGKSRAKLEKITAESTAKISAALSLGYVTFRNSEESDRSDDVLSFLNDEGKRGIVSSVIGYALTSTLAKETRLSGWLNDIEYPSTAFGYCALIFDSYDWMPQPTHPLNVAFRPNTKADNITQWVTFDTIDAEELYKRWTIAYNEKLKIDSGILRRKVASSGWILEGLESVLLKAYSGRVGKGEGHKVAESWQEVIPLYEENPSYVITNTSSVSIAKIFHKELNGTLSEIYIPWDSTWNDVKSRDARTPAMNTNKSNEIVFKKNHGPYDQSKHICLIRDSGFTSEAGCIQDYRGIAKPAVEDSIRYNRLRNGMNNKMTFIGSPFFEQPTSQTAERFKINVSQGFILLPPSHKMIERQPTFDISSHINVMRFEESEYMRDTQQHDATIQGRLTSRPNRGEVQRVTEEVEFTDSAKNNIKFRDYSSVFHSVLTRMPSIKCRKDDPGYQGKNRFYEIIKKNLTWLVKTNSDIDKILSCIDSYVLDPVTNDIELITMAIQMAETPFARNRLKRMLLIAKGMPIEEVNIAVPLTSDKFASMQDDRMAAIENDMMFTTNEIIVNGTDDHIVHLDSHFAKASRVIQGFSRGAISPVDAFKYLENNIIHSQSHVEKLGEDPVLNKKAQEYQAQLAQINNTKNRIKSVAEKIMQEKAQQEGQIQLDPETQADIASKNAKVVADTQRKDWLAQQRTAQRDKQIELSHEQRMREIELKNQNEQ
jgi:hypothetical protein